VAATATLRIYLARHGETAWNLEHRQQGWTDIPLDETGKKQAEALRELLRGIHLDRVYSSTLARSRTTAETAAAGAPLESLPQLRERNLGKFQGLRTDGSDPAVKAEWERRIADPEDDLDGGESRSRHYQRVESAVRSILSSHPSGTVLIVGHGGTNQMILRLLLGLDDAQAREIDQANDEVYLIEIAPGHPPRLWKRIAADHLHEL
jgi:broad specificity phosphatase PhoE